MPDKNLLAEINSEHEDINWRGVSDASDKVTVTVAGDTLAPAAPSSLTATAVPKGIKLELISPSTNADGTTCVDERWIKVYWQSTAGVSKSSYDSNVVIAGRVGENQTYTDTNVSSGTTRYYVVTALDANGNESDESNEAHADGGSVDQTTSIPDDAGGYIFDDSFGADGEGVALGDGVIGIIFKHHNSSWTNFSHYRLWYAENSGSGFGSWSEITPINQIAFIHKGLNTSYHYKYKASIVANDGTESTMPDYATNNSNAGDGGAGYQPNKDNNSLFDGTVLVGNLVSENEVRGEHFYAQSYLAINDSTFGHDGIQLEYNSGDPRAYIGNGATDSTGRFIKFDGTDLSWQGKNSSLTAGGVFTATNAVITGALTAGAGSSISGAYISSLSFDKITAATNTASLVIGSGGYLQSSNYSSGSAGFRINGDGSAEFQNATIRGTLNASDISGGTMSFSYITQSSVDIIESMIHSDAVTNAKIAANAVRTSELYIDGDVNFAANGTRHALYGVNDIYASTSKSISEAYIQVNAGNIQLYESSSGSHIGVDSQITVAATNNVVLSTGSGYSVQGCFKYSGATVYPAAAAKTSWTNLDLSGTIGSIRALVLLRVQNGSTASINYRFRPDGYTVSQAEAVDNYPGVFSTRVDTSSDYNYVWCMTSSTGVIEWDADLNGTTTIVLVAYIT